ncbi:MAG TPA: hypothetical protein PKH28_09795, partial [Candidatus Competibacteraceae bacterium]|nr:hypothetical protein [Candidatus Competibacteraceae bacterium]
STLDVPLFFNDEFSDGGTNWHGACPWVVRSRRGRAGSLLDRVNDYTFYTVDLLHAGFSALYAALRHALLHY